MTNRPAPPTAGNSPAAPPPTFVNLSYSEMHRLFPGPPSLRPHNAPPWDAFRGKFVRWRGQIVSFTSNGLTFRHKPDPILFSVSLRTEGPARAKLARLHVGEYVTYIGRLDHVDEVFGTIYMDHGDVDLETASDKPD